jgi:hypothetical protein
MCDIESNVNINFTVVNFLSYSELFKLNSCLQENDFSVEIVQQQSRRGTQFETFS